MTVIDELREAVDEAAFEMTRLREEQARLTRMLGISADVALKLVADRDYWKEKYIKASTVIINHKEESQP